MQRFRISFHSAFWALLLAILLPSIVFLFGIIRSRQLQSTANPRWAQFARLTGPQSESTIASRDVKSAELANHPPESLPDNPQFTLELEFESDLPGSLTELRPKENPIRAELLTELEESNQPSTEDYNSRRAIIFRPVDDDAVVIDSEAIRVFEKELQAVHQRLDELSRQYRETEARGQKQHSHLLEREIAFLNAMKNREQTRVGQQPVVVEVRPQVSIVEKDLTSDTLDRSAPRLPVQVTEIPSSIPRTPIPSNPVSDRQSVPSIQESADSTIELEAPTLAFEPAGLDAKVMPSPQVSGRNTSSDQIASDNDDSSNSEPGKSQLTDDGILIRRIVGPGSREVYSMDVHDADLRQFLCRLSHESRTNILPSPGVTGRISLSLHEVPFETALNAILKSRSLSLQRDGNIVFINTDEEISRVNYQNRQLMMRIYRPNFLSASEVSRLIKPILSDDGRHSFSSPSRTGLQPEENREQSGIDQLDAVIVQDYADVLSRIDQILVEMDVPPLQVSIEAKIVRVQLSEQYRNGIEFGRLPCRFEQVGSSPEGCVKQASLTRPVAAFLKSVEKMGEIDIVATQQIQVLNKNRAEMVIADRIGFRSLCGKSLATMETGARLIFRPSISADGLIRMEIHPERNVATSGRLGRISQQTLAELTTHVLVRDGETLVIGGMITEQTADQPNGHPRFNSIPLVGASFRNRVSRLQHTELMVLVTPRIVTDSFNGVALSAESPGESAGVSADPTQRTSGNHLARAHYERAAAYYRQGNLVKARQQVVASCHQGLADQNVRQLKAQIDHALASEPLTTR